MVDTVRQLAEAKTRIAELEANVDAWIDKYNTSVRCIAELEARLHWYLKFMREYDRAAKQHAMPSYLDDARKA